MENERTDDNKGIMSTTLPKYNTIKRPKRKVNVLDLINRSQFLYMIDSFQSNNINRDKALIVMLYLTGARISEVVRSIKKYDIDIQELNGHNFYVINNIKCLKRRKGNEAQRNIGINAIKESEFLKYIDNYLKQISPEQPLFTISRQRAYKIVRKFKDDIWPHYFRHLRLSHLTTLYGFNSADLRQYTGWTDDKPAAEYVHLNWKDVAKKMI